MKAQIVLLVILLLALCVRLYQLEESPPGLYPDEAVNVLDALETLDSGEFRFFYPKNNGREGGYIALQALVIEHWGLDMTSIRLVSVIAGVVTVLCLYLVAYELFPESRSIALIAVFLFAVSFWSILVSRLGFRAMLMLPPTCLLVYFISLALRTRRWLYYVCAGAVCGVGLYTYLAFRVAPVLILLTLPIAALLDRSHFRAHLRGMFVSLLVAAVLSVPLINALQNGDDSHERRSNQVSLFNAENRVFQLPWEAEERAHGLVVSVALTTGLALSKFVALGDPNWRHGYPPYPQLEPLTAVAFLLGMALLLVRLYRGVAQRGAFSTEQRIAQQSILLSIAWFTLFLAPEFLTARDLPHSIRSIGVMPIVFILAAVGFKAVYDRLIIGLRPTFNSAFSGLVIIWIVYTAAFGTLKYHVYWTEHPRTARAFYADIYAIGKAIAALPDSNAQVVVVSTPWESSVVEVMNPDAEFTIVDEREAASVVLRKRQMIFIPARYREATTILSDRVSALGGDEALIRKVAGSAVTLFSLPDSDF